MEDENACPGAQTVVEEVHNIREDVRCGNDALYGSGSTTAIGMLQFVQEDWPSRWIVCARD